MSARRDPSRRRQQIRPAAGRGAPRRGRALRGLFLAALILIPVLGATMAAAGTGEGRVIAVAVQRFLLFYSGVFALVALTAAVGAGLLTSGRIVLTPGRRVVAQAAHRAISLVALAALITHIVLEIVAHKARTIDAFVPFLAHGRTFYIGVGTIASDLVVLIIATGVVRRRFAAGRRPWAWRALHAAAYLAWPFAILHGLLAGRPARPYVDWSYGACLAAAGLALVMRYVATIRGRDTAAQPVPDRACWPANAVTLTAATGPAGHLAGRQSPPQAVASAPPPPRLALPPPATPAGHLGSPAFASGPPVLPRGRPAYPRRQPASAPDRAAYRAMPPAAARDQPHGPRRDAGPVARARPGGRDESR